MGNAGGLEAGLTVRSVASGFVAMVHHGDGTSTSYWGPTRKTAKARAADGDA